MHGLILILVNKSGPEVAVSAVITKHALGHLIFYCNWSNNSIYAPLSVT